MRQFNTLTGFLLSTSSNPTTSDTVEFQGFTSIGDGYFAKFQHNGIIGQTVSQSPIDLGLATPTLNDADGNQWVLINGAIQEFNDVLFYPAPFGDSGKGLYSYLDYVWVKLSDTTFISPITTTDLINSSASFSSEVNITTTGFTTSGDGGSGSWIQNGVTGQTASQSPAQLGDALLNDANGDQWALVMNRQLFMPKVGLKTGQDNYSVFKIAQNVINNTVNFISIAFPIGDFYTTASSEYVIDIGGASNFSIIGNQTKLSINNSVGAVLRIQNSNTWRVSGLHLFSNQIAVNGYHGVAITDCKAFTYENGEVWNTGGYGIGLQGDATASYENCTIQNMRIYQTGADGIDFKNNEGTNRAIIINNIYVEDPSWFNDGKVGVDIRGPATVSNIHVVFKNNTNFNAIGVRTRGPVLGSEKSTLVNIIIDDLTTGMLNVGVTLSDKGVVATNITTTDCLNAGVSISIDAPDSQLINCVATRCGTGFANSAENAKLLFCEAIDSTSEGFKISGVSQSTYAFCESKGAGTYGFRSVSGSIDITAAYCKSSGSGTNDYALGSTARVFMCDGYTGDSLLQNADSAYVKFGTRSNLGAEVISGFMEVKDVNGNIRKLAVIS